MKVKNSIVFIVPYFGTLPNYFSFWLKSCEYNSNINWLLFSDDKTVLNYFVPENVRIEIISFNEFKFLIQKNYQFKISIEGAYKLTDFKPAYGEILQDYIGQYDFWGFTDIDLIYGSFDKFVSHEILNEYDKIFVHGHLSIIKNNNSFNVIYKKDNYYKKVFSDTAHYGFDEYGKNSYNEKCIESGIKIYTNNLAFADINSWKKHFSLTYVSRVCNKEEVDFLKNEINNLRQNSVFVFDKGKLVRFYIENNMMYTKEYLYVHFQKRAMNIERVISKKESQFTIIPNKFVFDGIDAIDSNFLKTKAPKLFFSNKRIKRQIYITIRMFFKNKLGI